MRVVVGLLMYVSPHTLSILPISRSHSPSSNIITAIKLATAIMLWNASAAAYVSRAAC